MNRSKEKCYRCGDEVQNTIHVLTPRGDAIKVCERCYDEYCCMFFNWLVGGKDRCRIEEMIETAREMKDLIREVMGYGEGNER